MLKSQTILLRFGLLTENGYLRGVYHAASEDALRDATEDIALLRKKWILKSIEVRKLLKGLAEEINVSRPDLPVLGTEGHTVPPFAFWGIDSVEVTNRDVEGKIKRNRLFLYTLPYHLSF